MVDLIQEPIRPLYMWAGGKSKMLSSYQGVMPSLGNRTYVEPFFGGGAIYCSMMNHNYSASAMINDINSELMGLMVEIRDRPDTLVKEIGDLVEEYLSVPYSGDKKLRKEWFYRKREEYWGDPTSSLLFVLMRTSFNGIWQTCKSSNGLFGTPAGLLNHNTASQIYKDSSVFSWSHHLQRTAIHCGDYSDLDVPENSLIFLDPPYRDSFTTYGTMFNDSEQRRLVEWSKRLVDAGQVVAISNRTNGDGFFEELLEDTFTMNRFDVVYTAGRRKKTADGFAAKRAVEFLAISNNAL